MRYVTLVSSQDYVLPAIVLNRSLKKVQSKYSLIIVITEDVFCPFNQKIFENEHIDWIVMPPLQYGVLNKFDAQKPSLKNTASKFNLFRLPFDEKLIFLDADIYVQQNIDDLFNFPDGAILAQFNPNENKYRALTGAFVFNPKYHSFELYSFLLNAYSFDEEGKKIGYLDGEIIEELFFCFRSNKDYLIDAEKYFGNDIPNKPMLHFQNKKPFLMSLEEMHQYKNNPLYQNYIYDMCVIKLEYGL